ncbi:MAG: hypothetical protein AB4041_04715 [Microcystaceae cyanobacterium]
MNTTQFVKAIIKQSINRTAKWGLIGVCSLLGSNSALAGVPNGTWLSKPQIRYHVTGNTLNQVMEDIQRKQYRLVFLDFRGVSDSDQRIVSQTARNYRLIPVVWIQSPQYRALSVTDLIYEARHGDAIQIDDHFFTNYSRSQFRALSYQYQKPIFCSIQPFQSHLLSGGRCNQIDVQCYVSSKFDSCLKLADQLQAIVSLYYKDTFRYEYKLGSRRFNVFLWPYRYR